MSAKSSRRVVSALSLMLLTSMTAALRADDAPRTMSVKGLQALVTGLGLADAGDKSSFVEIDNQGGRGLAILMHPVEDDKYVQFYTNLATIPKDKLAAMPCQKILAYNDDSAFYFTVGGTDNGSLFLQARLDASTITPQLLRREIDGLIAAADETADLWDTDKWKSDAPAATAAAAAPAVPEKTYDAMQADADARWEKTPMEIRHAMFTTDKVDGFGNYTQRPDATFKWGDVAHIYFEPFFYDWKPAENGLQALNVAVDVELKQKDGTVLMDQKNMLGGQPLGRKWKIKEVDYTLDLTLKDTLPLGG